MNVIEKSGAERYRYGFNGQQLENEISGKWNSLSAPFWEYDPRSGRRWNLDPRPIAGVSEYSAFNNNPILFTDPLGDTTIKGQKYEAKDMQHATHLKAVEVVAKYKPKPKPEPKPERNFTEWYAVHANEYNNQVEAYRAWQSSPFYHQGESKWDRIFRGIGAASLEARKEYASGGYNMFGGAGRIPKAATAIVETENATNATAQVVTATLPEGAVYSVAFEMKLPNNLYPGFYRGAHFKAANEALAATMEADPAFANTIAGLGIKIPRSSTGTILAKSPTNWVWHHSVETGIMQLVPKVQHTPGSAYWITLHPNYVGGFHLWGE